MILSSLLGTQVRFSAEQGEGRHLTGQLHAEGHLRVADLLQWKAIPIPEALHPQSLRPDIGPHQLQTVAHSEFIVQGQKGISLPVTGLHLGHDLPVPDISGILGVLPGCP